MTRTVLFPALISALIAGTFAAASEDLPVLKSEATVSSEIVVLGDLVANAGEFAEKPVFRAPDLGMSGTVRAGDVEAAARRAGLEEIDSNNVAEVTVSRASRIVTETMLQEAVLKAVADRNSGIVPANLSITFNEPTDVRHALPGSMDPVRIRALRYGSESGRFEALVELDTGHSPERFRLSGTAVETVEISRLTRPVRRGQIIGRGDVEIARVPRRSARNIALADPEDFIGMSALRSLQPGAAVALSDFEVPPLIKRNEMLTVMYEVPGLVVTTHGRALDDGRKDETISVINTQSNRVLQAVVVRPGLVRVMAPRHQITQIGS